MGQRTALVIGSEGFIGSRTARRLADLDWNVTRSAKEQLDLRSPSIDWLHALPKMAYVFCCALLGAIDESKRNDLAPRAVNVHGMISELKAPKIQCQCGYIPRATWCFPGNEVTMTSPMFLIRGPAMDARTWKLRSISESPFSLFLIVPLTKVYGLEVNDRTLFTSWLDSWAQQQRASVATDLTISPVYVGDVTNSLLTLIEGGSFGVRHVAGPEIASVYDFAVRLARCFRVATTSVKPVSRTFLSAVEARPRFQTLRSRDGVTGQGVRLTFDRMVERLLQAYPLRVN